MNGQKGLQNARGGRVLGVYTKSIAIRFGWILVEEVKNGLGTAYNEDRKRVTRMSDRLNWGLWKSDALFLQC